MVQLMQNESQSSTPSPSGSPFPATMWSLVMEASQQSDPAQVQDALKQLCEIYRRPIVEWLLRRGYGQNSEDLANDFVVFLLEKNRLENFARGTARFRSFLIKCLKRFLRDQWRKGN